MLSYHPMRYFKIQFLCWVLCLVWFSMQINPANAFVALMYHRFGEDQYPTTSVKMEQFKAHLNAIHKANLTIIPLGDILNSLDLGQEFPPNTIAITIDDAFVSFFKNAWPTIQEQKIPVTLFLSTQPIDDKNPDYMTYDQLRILRDSGLVTFGGHAHNHVSLTKLSPEEITTEIVTSQKRLKDELNVVTPFFSYPYGESASKISDIVKKHGYRIAFGQHSGVASAKTNPNSLQIFNMPRFAINENYGNMDHFERVIRTLPLQIKDSLPLDPLLGIKDGDNPPLIGFTVEDNLPLDKLRCYVSNNNQIKSQNVFGSRIEIRLRDPITTGRTRINCTLAGSQGRWYWHGIMFSRNP